MSFLKLPSCHTYSFYLRRSDTASNLRIQCIWAFPIIAFEEPSISRPFFFSVQERAFVLKTGGRRPQEAVKPLKRPHHKASSLVGNGPLKCCHNIRSVFDGHRSKRLLAHSVARWEKRWKGQEIVKSAILMSPLRGKTSGKFYIFQLTIEKLEY